MSNDKLKSKKKKYVDTRDVITFNDLTIFYRTHFFLVANKYNKTIIKLILWKYIYLYGHYVKENIKIKTTKFK